MAMAGHCGTMWLLPVVLLFLQMVQAGAAFALTWFCAALPKPHRYRITCVQQGGKKLLSCTSQEQIPSISSKDRIRGRVAAKDAYHPDVKYERYSFAFAVTFLHGKLQRNHEASREKVTGTTASPDDCPQNEETTEGPSSHVEVTGEAGSLPSVPWQAVLLVDEYDEWFCGGTILNEYLLSGAHCVNQSKDLQVFVGMVDKEKEEPSRAMHRVEKMIAHAGFDTETFDSGIALLKLEEPITFSEDVVPACLPEEDFDLALSLVMKVLQIPYVDRDTCKLALRSPVTENMFCAGYDTDGKDVCRGDGGGPHVTKYNGTYFVTGIISWGEGCGRGRYGLYTNLSKFLPWVRSVLTENS
ncbi:LOW QUALITY PROTEIN: coagulation factor X-like [Ciconia maguari]